MKRERYGPEWQEILSTEIVVGDLIKIERGMRVPADCILTDVCGNCNHIELDQKLLNGPHEKNYKAIPVDQALSAQKNNMLPFILGHTFVQYGHGRAIVCAVGRLAQFGLEVDKDSMKRKKPSFIQKKIQMAIADKSANLSVICALIVFLSQIIWTEINHPPIAVENEKHNLEFSTRVFRYGSKSKWLPMINSLIYALTLLVVSLPVYLLDTVEIAQASAIISL